MSKPNVSIFDMETKETIVREMTDEEYAQHLLDKEKAEKEEAIYQEKLAEEAAAKAAVEAKLAALGLDIETVKAIAKLG